MARRLLAAAIVLSTTLSGPALAQEGQEPKCGPKEKIFAELAQRYGEHPLGSGPTADGLLLTITRNPDTGAWTAVVSSPHGRSCWVEAGENWRSAEPTVPGQES